jgi:hypothetical protein
MPARDRKIRIGAAIAPAMNIDAAIAGDGEEPG